MGTESDGEVGVKCNIMSTEREKETLWRHKENDNSFITCAFFITRENPVSTERWTNFCFCKNKQNIMIDCAVQYLSLADLGEGGGGFMRIHRYYVETVI
jgi:hypothetical protein